jgi:hypothetical protein
MKWRMSGDQVDLAWVTGGEDDNKGYIVEKRPSYGGDFQEVVYICIYIYICMYICI